MNKVLEDYYKIREEHDEALGRLDDEAERIVHVIKEVFKHKDAWWAYKYYHDEHDEPPLPQELDGGCFPIFIEGECDSGIWNYNDGFPLSFFDMTNEEIKAHIQKEITTFEEKEKNRKDKIRKQGEARIRKKELLKQKAYKKLIRWNKLTKEEKKALGI